MPERRDTEELVVPLHEETLAVGREAVDGDRVRIDMIVRERTERVEQLLTDEEIAVERVPIGTIVAEPPPVREEGDTLVIPLLEEVLVVERRLRLREEVRVRKSRRTVRHEQDVTLRSEEARVTGHPAARTPPAAAARREESEPNST